MKATQPDKLGHFGDYGGMYVPETLMEPLNELTRVFKSATKDSDFKNELNKYLTEYVGRPTPLYFAEQMTKKLGSAKIYLKREDLCHTGAHKINNAMGQILLAKRMGKERIIAETGAGQHGVATATVCSMFGFKCRIYMGRLDMERQALNVFKMRSMGAEVVPVTVGQETLKEAVNEAMRDWVTNVRNTHYIIGSALGSHPYPLMVREFQSVIGREARRQILKIEGRLPTAIVACVGGGSNAIGIFHPFIKDNNVRLIGVEAGGLDDGSSMHAARFLQDKVGILQGTKTYVLQNDDGQIASTHSISAGMDYAAIGPEHSLLRDLGRAEYPCVSDKKAVDGFDKLSMWEGVLPALESSHAISWMIDNANKFNSNDLVILNVSGRGDKDVEEIAKWKKMNG